MTILFTCPVCSKNLQSDNTRYFCDSNHSFDIARQGYVNLLPANRKKSKSPGDTAEMLRARGEFLNKGFYNFLLNELINLIDNSFTEKKTISILDVGCGEGFFLTGIKNRLGDFCNCFGTDISKPAIIQAAKRNKQIRFAVAGSFHLPIQSGSLDVILRMFAPGDNSEVKRCLKTAGILITVTPGPRHLYSLKKLLYKTPKLHDSKEMEIEGVTKLSSINIHQEFSVNNPADLQNLLHMTPYYWNGDPEIKVKLNALSSLDSEADFTIQVYCNKS